LAKAQTILLIEPDEIERTETAALLGKMGYEVDGAANANEGLRAFSERHHDLVIVEVLLSGMNGLKVCKIVKEQGEPWHVKVVVVSKVYKSRAMEYDALNRYQADAYFSRPFPMVELVNTINRLIGEPLGTPRIHEKIAPAPSEPAPKPRAISDFVPPAPPPKPAPPPAPEPAVAMEQGNEGQFDSMRFAALLDRLKREKFDGSLIVRREAEAKNIYFVEGRPVFVQSNIDNETLGCMLVEDEAITDRQYREAMVELAETGRRFGTIVVQRGYLTNDQLFFHLVAQTRRKIARCFAWPDGDYRLKADKRYPENAPTFEVDITETVLEGYRRYLDAGLLEAAYERDRAKYVFLGEDRAVAAVKPFLSEDETVMLRQADGRRKMSDLVGDSALGLIDSLRLLGALIALGALRVAGVADQPELSPYGGSVTPDGEQPLTDPRHENLFSRIKEFAVRVDEMSLPEILGVEPDADAQRVETAFAEYMEVFNPDALPPRTPPRIKRQAARIVRRLEEAHTALLDPHRRSERASEHDAQAAVGTPDERLQMQKGLVAMENREYGKAVHHFKQMVKDFPQHVEYRVKLAEALYKFVAEPIYKWADVEEAAKQVLAVDKKNAEALAIIGRVKAKEGDDELALKYLKKAFELEPQNPDLRREVRYAEQRLKETPTKKKSIFGKIL